MTPGRLRAIRTIAVCIAGLLAGCNGSPHVSTGAATASTTTLSGSSDAIPTAATTPLPDSPPGLVTVRAGGGRLYAAATANGPRVEIMRLDPDSGATLASGVVVDVYGWVPTPDGVLVSHTDLNHFSVLDVDTLALRHEIPLPDGARAALYRELVHSEATWVGANRRDEDQVAGRYTPMAAFRLDLAAGKVVDRRDTPPCGPHSATEISAKLLMVLVCSYQITRIDLTTGAVESTAGFPSAGSAAAFGDDAWFRWKSFGYLARITDAGGRGAFERIETLDLNTDGPVLIDLSGFDRLGDSIFIAGNPSGLEKRLLFRIDRRDFEVIGRAWLPGPHAIIGDLGYALDAGALVSFDPDSVRGAAPRRVVRPRRGPPAEVTARTPEEKVAVEAFGAVWDVGRTNQDVAAFLGNDLQLLDIRSKLVALVNDLYPGVTTRVTAIDVSDDKASISYVFIRDGELIFPPFTATLTRIDDGWQVDRDAVCQLATKAAVSTC